MEFIEAILRMERGKAMAHSNGIMEKNLKEIGKMVLKMDLGYGGPLKETTMKANGLIIGNKEKEHLDIKIVYIKDSSLIS